MTSNSLFASITKFHCFLCFQYIEPKPGNFIDVETDRVVGSHKGTHYWTLGQRINMGGLDKAYFVQRLDPKTQDIWVVSGKKL